jgi:signal transduction histidine kinase
MNKPKILYVDDEVSNLRIFKDTFRRKFEVFTAISGKEGLTILEENKIDLILSDQRMPEMSGIEFLKHTFEIYPNTRRILVTGFSDFDAVENAINQARVFQYIQKPWEEESLLKTIDDALRMKRLEMENVRQKEELLIAWKKAEESDRLKSEFINNISHEIRTPINGIYGFSELLGQSDIPDEEKNKYLNIIKRCSIQLVQTIDNILEFSDLVTKQQLPEIASVEINSLIDELTTLYLSINLNTEIDFTSQKPLPDSEGQILTDKLQLNNILNKLLDNAFKFTEKGKIELGYSVKDNGNIVFFVKDSGIGIDEKNQKEIYNYFSKASDPTSKVRSGLGLGLSIVQESAKLINANVWFESEKDKGTTFYVSLPFKQETIEPDETNRSKESIDIKTSEQEIKILVAEDEEVNYIYLQMLIKSFFKGNVEILWAQNGKVAIELCEKHNDINLVFMDIKMPLMNGYDATKGIKKNNKDIPIVAQTAYSTNEDKEKAFNAGCDMFLAKPFKKDELDSILNKIFHSEEKLN